MNFDITFQGCGFSGVQSFTKLITKRYDPAESGDHIVWNIQFGGFPLKL